MPNLISNVSRSSVLRSMLVGQRTIFLVTKDFKSEMNAVSATASRLGVKIRQSRGLVAVSGEPAMDVIIVDRIADDDQGAGL